MSMIITAAEIDSFRSTLADCPGALAALDVLDDCEGDLDDAAISLAIRAGQEPDMSDRWIEGLAKRWRHLLCDAEVQGQLERMNEVTLQAIVDGTQLPIRLATLVGIYVTKVGVTTFCEPLAEKLS